jgi:hypothetical protein
VAFQLPKQSVQRAGSSVRHATIEMKKKPVNGAFEFASESRQRRGGSRHSRGAVLASEYDDRSIHELADVRVAFRSGDVVPAPVKTPRSGFFAVGGKHSRFIHQVFNSVTGRMTATSDRTAVLASFKTGKSLLLPKRLQRQATAHLVTVEKGRWGKAPSREGWRPPLSASACRRS